MVYCVERKMTNVHVNRAVSTAIREKVAGGYGHGAAAA
jgi:hypothetical protein